VDENDSVILSARIIPGNEKSISAARPHVPPPRSGLSTQFGGTIHVPAHASQEEQKLLLQLVKPKYFIPVTANTPSLPPRRACPSTGLVRTKSFSSRNGRPLNYEDGARRPIP